MAELKNGGATVNGADASTGTFIAPSLEEVFKIFNGEAEYNLKKVVEVSPEEDKPKPAEEPDAPNGGDAAESDEPPTGDSEPTEEDGANPSTPADNAGEVQ